MDSRHEFLTVSQQRAPLEKGFFLPWLEICPLQFVDLELETVYTPRFLCLIHLQRADLFSGFLHGGKTGAIGCQITLHPAKAVQIGPVLLLIQELLPIVLPVDIEKLTSDLPQLSHGHRLSIHPTGVLPVGIDLPLEKKLSFLRG